MDDTAMDDPAKTKANTSWALWMLQVRGYVRTLTGLCLLSADGLEALTGGQPVEHIFRERYESGMSARESSDRFVAWYDAEVRPLRQAVVASPPPTKASLAYSPTTSTPTMAPPPPISPERLDGYDYVYYPGAQAGSGHRSHAWQDGDVVRIRVSKRTDWQPGEGDFYKGPWVVVWEHTMDPSEDWITLWGKVSEAYCARPVARGRNRTGSSSAVAFERRKKNDPPVPVPGQKSLF